MGLLLFTLVIAFGINAETQNSQPTAIFQATFVNAATSLSEETINIIPKEIKCDRDPSEELFSAFMEVMSVYWAAIALIIFLHIVCLYYTWKISVERKLKPENYDSEAEKIYEEWDPLTMWQVMA